MKNNLLAYLSIIHNEFQDHTDDLDGQLADADSGETCSVVEAKTIALHTMDQLITEIISLRNSLANKPLSELKKEYELTDD